MRHERSSVVPSAATAIAFGALLTACSALPAAATAASPGIHACAKKKSGALRLARRCRRNERSVSWSQGGPRGLTGAQGATGSQGPRGAEGTRGAEGPAGQPATALWARVDSAGSLVSGSHVASTEGDEPYVVTFDRDISKCAAVAAPMGPPLQVLVSGVVTGVGSTSNTVSIFVISRETGAFAKAEVSVAVFC